MCFNPYRVFKFVATKYIQSWSCDYAARFNPYRVFKFVATSQPLLLAHVSKKVSIPIGFSSSLQLVDLRRMGMDERGFNPYRVFKFVATACGRCTRGPSDWFQSLSGFQVRCNLIFVCRHSLLSTGFNPYRVFKFVATPALISRPPGSGRVSIPIGFSSSLQQPIKTVSRARQATSFNPYRVFKFVAT